MVVQRVVLIEVTETKGVNNWWVWIFYFTTGHQRILLEWTITRFHLHVKNMVLSENKALIHVCSLCPMEPVNHPLLWPSSSCFHWGVGNRAVGRILRRFHKLGSINLQCDTVLCSGSKSGLNNWIHD